MRSTGPPPTTDMVLDTASMHAEQAADRVVAAIGARGPTPAGKILLRCLTN